MTTSLESARQAVATKPVRRTLTQQIADYLGVTEEVGSLVRDKIDELWLVDWSEATQKEIDAACREAYAELV
jgi:t-SNARE complex subunit (syntaxin)